jgi:hypothetical protein
MTLMKHFYLVVNVALLGTSMALSEIARLIAKCIIV